MTRISSVRAWFRLDRYWETLLTVWEDGLGATCDAADRLWRFIQRRLPRRRRISLDLETLEPRVLLTAKTLQFLESNYTVSEAAGMATVTVERLGSATGTVSVFYGTSDGTAHAGSDYAAVSGMLVFADGQTSASFAVTVTQDSLVEGDEYFYLSLASATDGYSVGLGTATVTIRDDDSGSTGGFAFASATYSVSEGDGLATVTVERTGSASGSASVSYQTSDGTATAGSDYGPAPAPSSSPAAR
jgi:hypothetical protein